MGISVLSQESRTVCTAREGDRHRLGPEEGRYSQKVGSGCQTLSSDSFPEIPAEKGAGRSYHH